MHRQIVFESLPVNLRLVEKLIDEVTGEIGIRQEDYGKILVSTLEAVNNAIIHGNKSDPEKNVLCEMFFRSNTFIIRVTDEGDGFTPENIPDPTTPENIELQNGRGVFLMSKLSDKLVYNKKGNSVEMFFKRRKS